MDDQLEYDYLRNQQVLRVRAAANTVDDWWFGTGAVTGANTTPPAMMTAGRADTTAVPPFVWQNGPYTPGVVTDTATYRWPRQEPVFKAYGHAHCFCQEQFRQEGATRRMKCCWCDQQAEVPDWEDRGWDPRFARVEAVQDGRPGVCVPGGEGWVVVTGSGRTITYTDRDSLEHDWCFIDSLPVSEETEPNWPDPTRIEAY